VLIGGVGGKTEELMRYTVALGIHDLPQRVLEVLAHADEPWILLGRDVLNAHRLLLDGPSLTLEIE